mmetsp:Transcript_3066/g.12656  ORF Transcript_3066/g.12656 Transcript_3066/m.12656 type:complete len:301 (-) Transcript_3066:794-1696(-)
MDGCGRCGSERPQASGTGRCQGRRNEAPQAGIHAATQAGGEGGAPHHGGHDADHGRPGPHSQGGWRRRGRRDRRRRRRRRSCQRGRPRRPGARPDGRPPIRRAAPQVVRPRAGGRGWRGPRRACRHRAGAGSLARGAVRHATPSGAGGGAVGPARCRAGRCSGEAQSQGRGGGGSGRGGIDRRCGLRALLLLLFARAHAVACTGGGGARLHVYSGARSARRVLGLPASGQAAARRHWESNVAQRARDVPPHQPRHIGSQGGGGRRRRRQRRGRPAWTRERPRSKPQARQSLQGGRPHGRV